MHNLTFKDISRGSLISTEISSAERHWYNISCRRQTCASADVTECMAENHDRADGWSGQRSTTVCLTSGECSSTCLQGKIRKVKQVELLCYRPEASAKTLRVKNLENIFVSLTTKLQFILDLQFQDSNITFQVSALTYAPFLICLSQQLGQNNEINGMEIFVYSTCIAFSVGDQRRLSPNFHI